MVGETIGISKCAGIPSSRALVCPRTVDRAACRLSRQPVAYFILLRRYIYLRAFWGVWLAGAKTFSVFSIIYPAIPSRQLTGLVKSRFVLPHLVLRREGGRLLAKPSVSISTNWYPANTSFKLSTYGRQGIMSILSPKRCTFN